jgi:hypothetical protein
MKLLSNSKAKDFYLLETLWYNFIESKKGLIGFESFMFAGDKFLGQKQYYQTLKTKAQN